MDSIVCATRAGEGSRAVQMAAIKEAKASGKPLVFVTVIDPESLGDIDEALKPAVREELLWMGKTLLRIAENRAKAEGIEPELIIKEGNVRDEIRDYVTSTQPFQLLLGAPRGTTANVFGDDEIERFAQYIEESTSVTVRIIRPDRLQTTTS